MRYLLHKDVVYLSLRDVTLYQKILQLSCKHSIYISAYLLGSALEDLANNDKKLQAFKQLMRSIHIAKIPNYLDKQAILATADIQKQMTIASAQATDTTIVTNLIFDNHTTVSPKQCLDTAHHQEVGAINFVDLQFQYHEIASEIACVLDKTLNSSQFIMGAAVTDFEQQLIHFTGAKHAFACSNGSDALLLALLAIDIQPGDEVIVPCFSFIASASMPALLGAKIVFTEIDAANYNMLTADIVNKISAKTRAIIPVGLYGQPADMDAINHIAKQGMEKFNQKIYVIEDAAQSLGATYQGKQSGNLSLLAITSFFPSKPLGAYGDAGAIFTNDDDLAKKIVVLREHGQVARYCHTYIGINGRCDAMQAAILSVKLKNFAQEISIRQKIAAQYTQALSGLNLATPKIDTGVTSSWAQYTIRIATREKFIQYLSAAKIPTAIHYPQPLHLQPCFKKYDYVLGNFPTAEKLAMEVVSLPFSAYLTTEAQGYIIKTIQAYWH